MEIIEDDGKDSEVDANIKSGTLSESGELEGPENEEPHLKETFPTEVWVNTNSIVNYLYNKLEVEEDDSEFKTIVNNYFKYGILLLKARYVVDTLGEDNSMEVWFEGLWKYVPAGLARYIRNYVLELSRIKGPLNDWVVKVIKGHTRAIRHLYCVMDIDNIYRI